MKETLSIIPENPYLVLIGLNPTKEAIKNKAVFSRDEAFWNLLISAGILKNSIKEVDLKKRASASFLTQIHSDYRLGFADLLPLIDETDSKKVKVPKGSAKELFETTPNLKSAKRIALLGQKVVDAFYKEYGLNIKNGIKNWGGLTKVGDKKQFGSIGEIEIEGKKIEVFAMPFPVNNSIEKKHEFYSKLIH